MVRPAVSSQRRTGDVLDNSSSNKSTIIPSILKKLQVMYYKSMSRTAPPLKRNYGLRKWWRGRRA
uniref:Uncharacterized protein n=1 Tax=Arundo donax TaxID=35708 RepID=A0A0A9C465_ARUDO